MNARLSCCLAAVVMWPIRKENAVRRYPAEIAESL